MSFDIYVQAFTNGNAASRPSDAVRALLLEHATAHDQAGGFVQITYNGASADVYGLPEEGSALDGLMFNHVEDAAFELIVKAAQEADAVVMPVGCAVCVTSESQLAHLPAELREVVQVVRSGAELRAAISQA